jgi:hypothetical protein
MGRRWPLRWTTLIFLHTLARAIVSLLPGDQKDIFEERRGLSASRWAVSCTEPINASDVYSSFVTSNCPTRTQVDAWLELSGGTKKGYFEQFRRATPLLALGGAHSGSQLQLNASAHVCFFGDSIGRELFDTWARIAPMAPFTGFQKGYKKSFRTAACSPLHYWDKHSEKAAQGDIEWFLTSKCDTYFVTGLGPHCIRRPLDNKIQLHGPPKAYQLKEHRQFAESFFKALSHIAVTLDVPVVFMSSPVIEGDILNLMPAKGDSLEFRDLSLSGLFAMGEAESFNRVYGSNGEKFAAEFENSLAYREEHAWPPLKKQTPPSIGERKLILLINTTVKPQRKPFLRFYDLASFHRACPGHRCDGMHSSMTISKLGTQLCASQAGFSDYPFLAFLQESGLLQEWQTRGFLHSAADQQGSAVQPILQGSADHPIFNAKLSCRGPLTTTVQNAAPTKTSKQWLDSARGDKW